MSAAECLRAACVALWLLGASAARPAAPVLVRQPPRALLFARGDGPLRLECEARASPTPEYRWLKDGREVELPEEEGRPGGDLVLAEPGEEEEGAYQCLANNSLGVAVSHETLVRMAVLLPFPAGEPEQVWAVEGEPRSLACRPPHGFPAPEVDWIIQSGAITFRSIDSARHSVDPEGSLHFSSVSSEDAQNGTVFACTAFHRTLGKKALGNRVALRLHPSDRRAAHPITKQFVPPAEVVVLRGATLQLACVFGGTPQPEVSWVRGGDGGGSLYGRRATFSDRGRTVRIAAADATDGGAYECVASNGVDAPHSSLVHVFVQAPPSWVRRARDTVAFAGEDVSFGCEAGGDPAPEVRWFANGVPIQDSDTRFEIEGSTIELRNVSESDTAVLQCRASNVHGSLLNNFYLHVLGSGSAPHSEDMSRHVNSSVTLRCQHDGLGTVSSYTWLFGGTVLQHHAIGNAHLNISNITSDDAGVYSCLVETEEGNWTLALKVTLHVQDVPEPPDIARVTCRGLTAVVEWTPNGDGGAPVLHYHLQMNHQFSPETWESVDSDIQNTTAYTVSLSPWTNSTFRVRAGNEVGEGGASAPSAPCRSPEDVPYSNPEQVRSRDDDPHSLVIAWQVMPPIEHNAPGFFYKVHWRDEGDEAAEWSVEDVLSWERSELVVTDLPSFHKYLLRVEAHNAVGPSSVAASAVVGHSGENVPVEPPRNLSCVSVVDSTTAVLAWAAVPPESLRGHFGGYKVQAWIEGKGEETLWQSVVRQLVEGASVQMFRPASTHRVRVLAFNDKFDGPPSNTITVTTPEGTPGNVSSFEVHPLGSTALFVRWEPPLHPNGRLTSYRLYYVPTYSPGLRRIEEVPADDARLQRVLGGLAVDTAYRVTVRAKSGAGEGQAAVLETRTRGLPLSAPDEPHFVWSEDGTGVVVRWTPRVDGHPGSSFQAQYRKLDTSEWWTEAPTQHRDVVRLSGLEPHTRYELRVVVSDGDLATASRAVEVRLAEPDGRMERLLWKNSFGSITNNSAANDALG